MLLFFLFLKVRQQGRQENALFGFSLPAYTRHNSKNSLVGSLCFLADYCTIQYVA